MGFIHEKGVATLDCTYSGRVDVHSQSTLALFLYPKEWYAAVLGTYLGILLERAPHLRVQ